MESRKEVLGVFLFIILILLAFNVIAYPLSESQIILKTIAGIYPIVILLILILTPLLMKLYSKRKEKSFSFLKSVTIGLSLALIYTIIQTTIFQNGPWCFDLCGIMEYLIGTILIFLLIPSGILLVVKWFKQRKEIKS